MRCVPIAMVLALVPGCSSPATSGLDAGDAANGDAGIDAGIDASPDGGVPCSPAAPDGTCGSPDLVCVMGGCRFACSPTQTNGWCPAPGICVLGTCMPSRCGDGVVDRARGEYCDDANAIDGDGCDTTCTRACGAGCDDGHVCNGAETCAAGVCVIAPDVPDGTICGTGGKGSTCFGGQCVPNP